MNYKQITILKTDISEYIKNKYKDIIAIPYKTDIQYIEDFDKATKDVKDPSKAMFILPNGKLKKIEIDLLDYKINPLYTTFFDINYNNLYKYINLEHAEIKYLGFDLDIILKTGCIRIANNINKKELNIGMNLFYNKPTNKILQTIDELLIYYDTLIVDFFKDSKSKRYKIESNTIKQLKRDINQIYNSLHAISNN